MQVARKQREREAELEEKKRHEREAIISGAAQQRASPAPSPEKPDSAPASGGGSGYVPPSRRSGGDARSLCEQAMQLLALHQSSAENPYPTLLGSRPPTQELLDLICPIAEHTLSVTVRERSRLCASYAAHTGDGACRSCCGGCSSGSRACSAR